MSMFGENPSESDFFKRKQVIHSEPARSPERVLEAGKLASFERQAGTSTETQEALKTLGYPADYDPSDPGNPGDSESSAMTPYKVGEEYGYDVYHHPQKSWFVLYAPLPSVFYIDEQRLEVGRRYPNYELVYYMGSQVLVRKEPFVPSTS